MIKYNRTSFYPIKKKVFTSDIKKLFLNYIIKSNINDNFELKDLSSLNNLRDNSFLILSNSIDIDISNKKVLIITSDNSIYEKFSDYNTLLTNDLSNFYNNLANYIFLHDDSIDFVDNYFTKNDSYISDFAYIDPSVKIGRNCVIGRGVKIDKNSIIKDNVVLKYSIIGSNVIISDNSTIGGTGFGFNFHNRGSKNITPHLGIVYIDNNTYVGSSCTIDRAKVDVTYIGKNGMIDNLIHIAHNVEIGDKVCIAAQSGISGSVKIGSNVTIGGQVGFAGHINIGDNVIIAAKSGVTKNIKSNSTIAGFPAIDIKEWKRKIISERKNGYK
ncbi:MAG: hypothetical protein CBD35_00670 [Verrucomicrobia bacterium TMED175]|nr:MAG: hypothetical protein CBD35_00670 [Verrucomicrobia bacterium TMED175]|tara:strand:+ start:5900 stop:6883 length:984 start_codon:yes stop_codon:yes gene_type:complete